VSLSLPILARVLLALLTALLVTPLLISGLALLRLAGLALLAALSSLRITFAAWSLLSILFVCHDTLPFSCRFKASRSLGCNWTPSSCSSRTSMS
jgi:hypothetical protein